MRRDVLFKILLALLAIVLSLGLLRSAHHNRLAEEGPELWGPSAYVGNYATIFSFDSVSTDTEGDSVQYLEAKLAFWFPVVDGIKDKHWSEYSKSRRDSLLDRWTTEQVDSICDALTRGSHSLPDFVKKFPMFKGRDYQRLVDSLNESAGLAVSVELRHTAFDFRGIDLSFRDLSGVNLEGSDFAGANLSSANLDSANISLSNLTYANFTRASLRGSSIMWCDAFGADFSYSDLTNANMTNTQMQFSDLRYADLTRTELLRVNCSNSKCLSTRFRNTRFVQSNFSGADFAWAELSEPELSNFDLSSVKNGRQIVWKSLDGRDVVVKEEIGAVTYRDFQKAQFVYNDLRLMYQDLSISSIAKEFGFREERMRTRSLHVHNPRRWLRWIALECTVGYGERPLRLLFSFTIIAMLFGALYRILAVKYPAKMKLESTPIDNSEYSGDRTYEKADWRDCFWFSVLAITTVGYGALKPRFWMQHFRARPMDYRLGGWTRPLFAAEALIGLYLWSLVYRYFLIG